MKRSLGQAIRITLLASARSFDDSNGLFFKLRGTNKLTGIRGTLTTSDAGVEDYDRRHVLIRRVLTKDRCENCSFCSEVFELVVKVMVYPQRQINHFLGLRDDLRAAAKSSQEVADVAVVLFDRERQILAGEELVLGDEAVGALPIVGHERLAFDADLVEELLACGVITATNNPGDGSPTNRVIGSPNPELMSFFWRKCHVSSSVTTT